MDDFTADRWQRLDDLLDEALARDPDTRTAYLRAACGHDPALYEEALALLESADAAARALGESATLFAAPLLADGDEAPPTDLAPGAEVGPYRIEGELGRGGMGVVYRATRADGAFDRQVALKLVKRGMDTDEVLARFHRERRLLAALDHGAVARLLDAGAAADGRPFLVMELVDGEPITAYCDRHRLVIEERLGLFEQVGEAVAYAHRRLVVHRDLKPSNVLVTEDEHGRPRTKLLDFGIAKLLEEGDDDVLTQPGARRLTPAYASPEQRRGEAVTTASDGYALGVVLYELLAGRRPEGDGRPPSAAVSEASASARGTTAEKLRRRLRGDLDTIVQKALREEPEGRYPSVEGLLDDLRRHGAGLPVLARPASARYRVGKFVRRHRVGVAAAALVALAVLGGLSVALWQARVAARERDEAEATAALLEDLLAMPDPEAAERLDTLSVRDMLARGRARAEAELGAQPLLKARLLYVMGRTYHRMREYGEARAAFEQALALRRAHLGPRHEDTAETMRALGLAISEIEMGSPEAIALLREALAIQRERLGVRHPLTATTMSDYADILTVKNAPPERLDEGEAMLREALAVQRAAYGADHPDIARTLERLGAIAQARPDHPAAVALFEEALAVRQRLYGEGHATVAYGHRMLAWGLIPAGRPVEAERHVRTAIAVERVIFGDRHPTMQDGLTILASALRMQGRYGEAEAALREALAIEGFRPRSRAVTLGTLATVLREQGELEEAVAVQQEAIAALRRHDPAEPTLAYSIAKLADMLREQGDDTEAERVLLDGLGPLEAAHGAGHPSVQYLVGRLDALYAAQGRPERGAAYRAQLAEQSADPPPPDHPTH
jgi:serine/threonine-protein kinase